MKLGIQLKKKSVLPGFGISLGVTVSYLTILVLVPLAALVFKSANLSWSDFIQTVTDERVLASYKVSFLCAFIAAVFDLVFGLIIAWCLVRYDFAGKRIIDSLIDLPFALPTSVAGIALTTLYASNGFLGGFFEGLGVKIVYTQIGITLALIFIGLPFVVRTVQPVLADLDKEYEEAAASLGANRWQIITKVILPVITPALLSGFAMSFARSVGEYGSVIFIAGNLPFKTEIAPLQIVSKLEQFDYNGAAAIAIVMLTVSFVILLTLNIIEWAGKKKYNNG